MALNFIAPTSDAIEDYWNWNELSYNYDASRFPAGFLWGTGSSAFQLEGNQTARGEFSQNSWTRETFRPQPGIGCDHWNRYKDDIKLMSQAGIKIYRFSVDWSKIEPQEGIWDQDALDHYVDIARECLRQKIIPVVCLHHFVIPCWFADLGGFEKVENAYYFDRFAHYVFDAMMPIGVHWWMTFNEPTVVVLEGYLRGNLAPSKSGYLIKAGHVLKNMLDAHVRIAKVFHQKDKYAEIGIAHVMQPLHPYHDYNPLENAICSYFGKLTNETILEFFKTGHFNWGSLVKSYNPEASESIDYMGLNYYTHIIIKQDQKKSLIAAAAGGALFIALAITGVINQSTALLLSPLLLAASFLGLSSGAHREFEKINHGKSMYPEGLYACIEKAAAVGKPIYITENGVSDREGTIRDEFIKKHLYVISKAIKDGFDVRGYFYWCFINGFEWNEGYAEHYGLCDVDYENKTCERMLSENAKPFINLMREHAARA